MLEVDHIYIYILTISMYTVTPEKMELQPWVEEALFDWDAPLIGGIYIDSL